MEAIKKIGIIGGSGPEATILLQQMIIDIAREKYGASRNEHNPHLLIAFVPVLQDVKDDQELTQVIDALKSGAQGLAKQGADVMCLACNTHHLSLKEIEKHAGKPFLSMVDLVTDKTKELKAEKDQEAEEAGKEPLPYRVAVIGTSYTLRNALYDGSLTEAGIELVDIGEELTERSHKIIGRVLSGLKPEMVTEYEALITELTEKFDFDALILGCTEFSVLAHRGKQQGGNLHNIEIIDPLRLLAEAVVEASYKK